MFFVFFCAHQTSYLLRLLLLNIGLRFVVAAVVVVLMFVVVMWVTVLLQQKSLALSLFVCCVTVVLVSFAVTCLCPPVAPLILYQYPPGTQNLAIPGCFPCGLPSDKAKKNYIWPLLCFSLPVLCILCPFVSIRYMIHTYYTFTHMISHDLLPSPSPDPNIRLIISKKIRYV